MEYGVDNVLGSARTGLIFTKIQERAQPGGLTQPQPGQTEPGIPYHVLSCWVPDGGGAARQELTRSSGVCSGNVSGERLCCAVCFVVFSPFLYRCYCSLCLLFC